jgi:hypothetical protein
MVGLAGEYLPGQHVRVKIELDHDDLLRICDREGLPHPMQARYAIRLLRIEAKRRLLNVLEQLYGTSPNPPHSREKLDARWNALLSHLRACQLRRHPVSLTHARSREYAGSRE